MKRMSERRRSQTLGHRESLPLLPEPRQNPIGNRGFLKPEGFRAPRTRPLNGRINWAGQKRSHFRIRCSRVMDYGIIFIDLTSALTETTTTASETILLKLRLLLPWYSTLTKWFTNCSHGVTMEKALGTNAHGWADG